MFKRIVCALLCTSLLYSLIIASSALEVSAKSAVVIESTSKSIVYEKNAEARLPMASTTKIMTGLIAVESGRLNDTVTVDERMIGAEGSSIYLKVGEKLLLKDLVYALMLASANDAAEAIAVFLCGSIEAFAEKMNERAREISLSDTSFANPHGLDSPDHYTTAKDLAILTVYALENEIFKEIVSTYRYQISKNEISPARYLVNHNKMLCSYDGAIGVKTGFTKKSGRCLVSAAEKDGVMIVCVTLSAPDDWNDHKRMLDMGFGCFESVKIADAGSLRFELPVAIGVENSIFVSNKDELTLVLNKNSNKISCNVECFKGHYIFSNINKGDHIADAVFTSEGREIARIPLYAESSITHTEQKKGFLDLFN